MRKLSVLLAVLLVLIVPASLATAQDDVVEIEFWGGWTGPDLDVMQSIVDAYNAEQSAVKVNLTSQQWSPLFDAFIATASAGQSPDILAMHPQELSQFIVLGLLDPVDDIVANSEVFVAENFVPKAWDLEFYEGQMYGFPLDLGLHAVYYNLDMFEEAGIEAFPTDAESYLEAARLLTKDANGNHPGDEGFDADNIVQYAVNMHTNHHAFFQWWSLYNQTGATLISEDGMSCSMDVEKSAAAWAWLQDLVYVHHAAPQGQTDYVRDFLSGRTAMLVDGPWQVPAMEAAHEESGFNWDTASYPTIFEQPAVWGSGHNLTLPSLADPAKREASVAFLEWMLTNADMWVPSGQIPIFLDILNSEDFQSLKGRAAYVDMLEHQVLLPNIPKHTEIFAANAPTPMMIMAQRIILEQADPLVESQNACDAITGILSIP
jgi:multiple sugar transport system substrate-binding protein